MIVAVNIAAMNAQRQLDKVGKAKAKSMEKLSSGFRTNRAADDSAGLSISEKMRKQIRGLNRGAENIQDGISLIQVADGALNEVHDMLHRISELAVQAANETNSQTDRIALQDEINQLSKEIDRISNTTSFNEKKLFTGAETEIRFRTEIITETRDVYTPTQFNFSFSYSPDYVYGATTTMGVYNDHLQHATTSYGWDIVKDEDGNAIDLENILPGKYTIYLGKIYISFETAETLEKKELIEGLNDLKWSSSPRYPGGARLYYVPTFNKHSVIEETKEVKIPIENEISDLSLWIQSGAEAGDGMNLKIETVNSEILGIDSIDLTTIKGAESAIDITNTAVEKVSKVRSNLGAQQNRLEASYRNITNVSENTQAAESRIRDTDMAREMVEYTKLTILEQVGQAMLTQANQINQGVLNLLQ